MLYEVRGTYSHNDRPTEHVMLVEAADEREARLIAKTIAEGQRKYSYAVRFVVEPKIYDQHDAWTIMRRHS